MILELSLSRASKEEEEEDCNLKYLKFCSFFNPPPQASQAHFNAHGGGGGGGVPLSGLVKNHPPQQQLRVQKEYLPRTVENSDIIYEVR